MTPIRFFVLDRKLAILGGFVIFLLSIGTMFYHITEGRTILDSLYFSVITLTTIGYGDMIPQTDTGKIFTILYIFLGLGTFARFVLHISRKKTWRIYEGKGRSGRAES